MSTPNNHCDTCDHSQYKDGGHCYMFREEPEDCQIKSTKMKGIFIHTPMRKNETNRFETRQIKSSLTTSTAIALAFTNLKANK